MLSHICSRLVTRSHWPRKYTLSPASFSSAAGQNRPNYRMNTAYFRWQDDDGVVDITLHFECEQPPVNKAFNFKRKADELIATTLNRIKTNVEKELQKKANTKKAKSKKKDGDEVSGEKKQQPAHGNDVVVVSLLNATGDVITGINWTELFINKPELHRNAVLRVKDVDYAIAFNYPYVGRIDLPINILVGYDCFPAKLDLQFTSSEECSFVWYKGLPKPNHENAVKDIKWTQCGSGYIYRVQAEDVGYKLKLECIPKREDMVGVSLEAFSKCIVEVGPGVNVFEMKQKFTPIRLAADGRQFRVVSYNLLADFYADSDFSRTELFPYCPAYALAIDYRKQLFVREIRGYNSDIVCMQEVDEKIFDVDLTLLLGQDGMRGLYQKKGDTMEGLATFYHTDKFSAIQSFGFNLADKLTTEPCFSKLYKKIKQNSKLCERMTGLHTALQVSLLKAVVHNKYLLVANTHLYFHPDADHIRLLQIGFFMSYIRHIRDTIVKEHQIDNKQLSIIFCGDFNSVPECGIFKLMTQGFVPDDFVDFRSNEEQTIANVCLRQPYNIASAYNNVPYTNYTVGFKDCLDYIFYEADDLKVVQAVPLPSEEELSSMTAIPSICFPSDHIALVADLEWATG